MEQQKQFMPDKLIHAGLLPADIQKGITELQGKGLAFANKEFKVTSANIQSFQTGSVSKGHVTFGGLQTALGASWGAFGGVGAINQDSINLFKTDVQMKLEDANSEKFFLNYSLPFRITLSIDPGERICIYFVQGGLRAPTWQLGDFRLDQWTAFVAKNLDTGQTIPIRSIPTLLPPKFKAASWLAGLIVASFFSLMVSITEEKVVWGIIISSFCLSLAFVIVFYNNFAKKKWKKDLEGAVEYAKSISIKA